MLKNNMQCIRHSPFRRHKGGFHESYKRTHDWWRKAAGKSWTAWQPSPRSGSYEIYTLVRKPKVWSLVPFKLDPQDLTGSEFKELVDAWRRDTRFHSSLSKKFTHWAYVTIMAGGKS